MSQYNKKTVGQPTVTNFRGGEGYKQSDEVALISLMASGLTKMFHEAKDDREKRLVELIQNVGKKDKYFLAQSIIYARTVLEQRTVTHRAAVELASLLKGEEWGKTFFSKRDRKKERGGIVYRLDDMLEITACYFALNPNKNLSNAMKKGFRMALESADPYEIAKYKGEGKEISLVDMVNLLHPKGQKHNAEAFKSLIEGKLVQFNTAESKQSEAGQMVAARVKSGEITKEEAKVELKVAKTENWKELITEKKIGYLALLRNLRNIINDSPNLVEIAGQMLTDEKFVAKSLVFPHQIDLALEVILNEQFTGNVNSLRRMVEYINKAYEMSVINVKALFNEGSTAIVLDSSSSMTSGQVQGYQRRIAPIDKSCLIGATLAKGLLADVYHFDSRCDTLKYNHLDSIHTIKQGFLQYCRGGSTNFTSIFDRLDKPYDRVFIISDMQGADSLAGSSSYSAYKKKYNCNPYIYSIDLQGYGTSMFKQNDRLFSLVGYSASIYESAKLYETDYNALINEIRKIVI